MSVLVVLVVMANPTLPNFPQTKAHYTIQKIQSDIRYAQLLAIETQLRTRFIGIVASDLYAFQIETAPNVWNWVTHPGNKNNFIVTLNAGEYQGVDITDAQDEVSAGLIVVMFDRFGAPYWANDTALTSPAYLELNHQYRLYFRPETGTTWIQ